MSDKPTPTTAKEFALRAAAHGLDTLEQFSDNPHDYGKVAGHLNETIRILRQIEWEEEQRLQWRPPSEPGPKEPTPKADAALSRLESK